MQTLVKYIFSESLRMINYKGVLIEIKKIRFSEYGTLFPKGQKCTNQVCFQSDLTPFSKNCVGKFCVTGTCLVISGILLNFES